MLRQEWLWMMSEHELSELDNELRNRRIRVVPGDEDWYLEIAAEPQRPTRARSPDKGSGDRELSYLRLYDLAGGRLQAFTSTKSG